MNLSEAKNKYIYFTKIDLDEENFVKLREPTLNELNELNEMNGYKEKMEALSKMFPLCLVDHSFTNEDGSKANVKEVYDMLNESGSLLIDVLSTWIESTPFQSRLKKKQK
jgi:hypothetical protein